MKEIDKFTIKTNISKNGKINSTYIFLPKS